MRHLFYLLVLIVVVALAALTFRAFTRPEPGAGGVRRNGTAAVAVEVASITTADLTDEGRFFGTLVPPSQFTVAPKVAGRLKRLSVDVGDVVRLLGALRSGLREPEPGPDVVEAVLMRLRG